MMKNYTVRRDEQACRWEYTMGDGTTRFVTDEQAARIPPIVDENDAPLLRGTLTEDERSIPLPYR
jgi:hypothetical protein